MYKHSLNKYERKILETIMEEGSHLSIREIADKCGMSWQTAKKYLDKLKNKDLLEEV
jgi:DNA-binding MarR family transcriptional regulator